MWAPVLFVTLAGIEFADPARKPVATCKPAAISFRTPSEGWFADECGKIFRSADSGESWVRSIELESAILGTPGTDQSPTSHHVARLVWRTPEVGLAFLDAAPFVMRTADAGATWRKVEGLWRSAFAIESLGAHVWICDSSGAITESPDDGVTWIRGQKVLEESPVPTDACSGLSFLDDRNGWALGWKSLWQTFDGGRTWAQLQAPASGAKLTAVTRLSREVGWLRADSGARFVTSDGGKSWKELPAAHSGAVAPRSNGRPVLLSVPARSTADRDPTLEANEDELDSRPALSVGLLRVLSLLREGPLLSPGSAKRVALAQVVDRPSVRWASSDGMLFRSRPRPDGEWYLACELSSPVEKLVVLENGSVLARTKAGLFKDGTPTETSSDLIDFDRLDAADKVAAAERSLDCLQNRRGWLELEWGSAGCFHHKTAFVRVELEEKFARVKATNLFSETDEELRTGKTLTGARGLIAQLSAAATRPEAPTGCRSTTGYWAYLRWRCGEEPERHLRFSTSACNRGWSFFSATSQTDGRRGGYDRTLGIVEVAHSLFTHPDGGTP